MARPRKTETRRPVSIRLAKSTLAAIDLLALEEHETRTQTIERILVNSLGSNALVAELNSYLEPTGPETPCKHPKDQRQVHSWGAVCGACSQRL